MAPHQALNLSLSLCRYLEITAALSGGAIMVVEILGAKMLAPYVGTSHFVWTAQIAVTLIALALGYAWGGRLADRTADMRVLYLAMLAAALYLVLAVWLVRPVALAVLRFDLALASLLAAVFLFLVPLALLAMSGPLVIRALTPALHEIGGSVGRLYAISTAGSVVGTVLIGYVLIPLLSTSSIMLLVSGILIVTSLIYWVVWQRLAADHSATLLLALSMLALIGAAWRRDSWQVPDGGRLLFRGNSNFGELAVVESADGQRRLLLNDLLAQNAYDPTTQQSLSLFSDVMRLLVERSSQPLHDALCIGMGVGLLPQRLASDKVAVDAVEINPAVVPLARTYFDADTSRYNLIIGDGRYFLHHTTKRYDAVFLDAFLGDASPGHLMTKEAFTAIRKVLRTNGILVINSFGEVRADRDFLAASLMKTLNSVFANVEAYGNGNGNLFFVARMRDEKVSVASDDLRSVHPAIRSQVAHALATKVQLNLDHGTVLTDDFNPAEFYDAGNRERFRRLLALSSGL